MKICETNISKVSARHNLSSSFYSKRSCHVIQCWSCSVVKYGDLAFIIVTFIFESLIAFEQLGNNLFDEIIKERMQPKYFDPMKISTVKTFTSSNKPLKLKVYNNVIEQKENSNSFALCALVKYIKIIDMRTVIGEHEVANVSLRFFNPDGSLTKVMLVNQALLTRF